MITSKSLELLRSGLRSLVGYPLRTLLTMLGVIFGVGSVIAMLALGTGMEAVLLEEFGKLGIENIILNTVKPPEKKRDSGETNTWSYHRYGLTFKDEEQIEATVPGVKEVLPVHKRLQTVWWGSRRVEATVYAVKPRHLDLFDLRPVRGRRFGAGDSAALRRVCLIRNGLLETLGIYQDPLTLDLQLSDGYYRVIGVLPDEEFAGYAQKALAIDAKTTEIYVPYETVRQRVGTRTVTQRQGSREATDVELSQIIVAAQDIDEVVLLARMLQRVLEANHEEKDYDIAVPLEALQQKRRTQEIFRISVLLMALITLGVGGIGIANIMLATVTERTREIGIRRALGAKRRHIMAQFLAEATAIAVLGGLLGVGCGYGFRALLVWYTGWKAIITSSGILLALFFSILVGILSGIFPARRAAYLDPIAALRHE